MNAPVPNRKSLSDTQAGAQLVGVEEINVDQIEFGERLREISEQAVDALAASIHEVGVLKTPIDVRSNRGKLVLIDGGHRLTLARRLGWTSIKAQIWDCSAKIAELMEIDGNLAGAELTVLDSAVFLAKRKRLHDELHPEAQQGKAGAAARWSDATAIVSFASVTSQKFGLSERHVRRLVRVGGLLSDRDVGLLRQSQKAVTFADLDILAKMEGSANRTKAVEAFSKGDATRIKQVIKGPVERRPSGSVEENFKVLERDWRRANLAAKRRFAEEYRTELQQLLSGSDPE
jgi:ParB family chromosome partitioning protein